MPRSSRYDRSYISIMHVSSCIVFLYITFGKGSEQVPPTSKWTKRPKEGHIPFSSASININIQGWPEEALATPPVTRPVILVAVYHTDEGSLAGLEYLSGKDNFWDYSPEPKVLTESFEHQSSSDVIFPLPIPGALLNFQQREVFVPRHTQIFCCTKTPPKFDSLKSLSQCFLDGRIFFIRLRCKNERKW